MSVADAPGRRSGDGRVLDPERVVAATLELTAVPAPTGEEAARGHAVAGRLRELGLAPERDVAGNVVVAFGPAAPTEAPLALSAHLDTVFGQDVPLAPVRDGDVLRGPGVGDDTLAVAALLELARDLAAVPPERPVLLAWTVGEEGLGDLRGAKALLAARPVRALIAVEGHGLDELVGAAIGSVRLRATYAGAGGHSWGDRGTPSAVHAALRAGARALDAVPAGAHVNVGTVAGGTTVNAIAASAELLVDLRDADPAALAATAAAVEAALAAAEPGVEATVERVGDRPAGAMAHDHPVLEAVRAAAPRRGSSRPPRSRAPRSATPPSARACRRRASA